MTISELELLYSDMENNASDIIELRLDEMEHRMEELEEEGDYRAILALCQEYYEWGTCEDGEDYNMLWLENLIGQVD